VMSKPPIGPHSDEVEHAIIRLRREGRRWRVQLCLSLLCWSTALLMLIMAAHAGETGGSTEPAPLLRALCCLTAGTMFLSRPRGDAFARLAKLADVHTIGPLLEALDTMPDAPAREIRALLTRLLPRLTPTDAGLLNRKQCGQLYDALLFAEIDHNDDYLLAVLQGLEQVGNAEALRPIQKLAERCAVTPTQHVVSVAATACLWSLQARLAQDRDRTALLRGAASIDSPTELLRPAHTDPDDRPDILLRPLYQAPL
jgi:hypothetical protein